MDLSVSSNPPFLISSCIGVTVIVTLSSTGVPAELRHRIVYVVVDVGETEEPVLEVGFDPTQLAGATPLQDEVLEEVQVKLEEESLFMLSGFAFMSTVGAGATVTVLDTG
jgi:hypothetical protein